MTAYRRAEGDTVTLQHMVRIGRIEPSPLSAQDETRYLMVTFRPELTAGSCQRCGLQAQVNYQRQCRVCWEPNRRINTETPWTKPAVEKDPVLAGRWKPTFRPFDKLPDFRAPSTLAGNDRLKTGRRQWIDPNTELIEHARYPWQLVPRESTRVRVRQPRRVGILSRDVWVRCLVCLRLTDLRTDQVCHACEKSWQRAGKPWHTDYDRFVVRRRADHAKESADHLASLTRAEDNHRVVQATVSSKPTSTVMFSHCDDTTRDNGVVGGRSRAATFFDRTAS